MSGHPANADHTQCPETDRERERERFHGLLRWSYVPHGGGQGQSTDKCRKCNPNYGSNIADTVGHAVLL